MRQRYIAIVIPSSLNLENIRASYAQQVADSPPTSRIARSRRFGGLVAGQGLRWAGTRAANALRSDVRADAATFLTQAGAAPASADWIGVHAYWQDDAELEAVLDESPAQPSAEGTARQSLAEALLPQFHPLPHLGELLDKALVEEPPALTKEGGMFRDGYHAALDELRLPKVI